MAIFSFLLRRAFFRANPANLADRLDETARTGGEIRSGVELDQSRAQTARYSADPALTAGLADMAVVPAAKLATGVRPHAVLPTRVLRRSALTATAAAVVVALLVLLVPRLAYTQWQRFTDPFGDHPAWSPYAFHVDPPGGKVVYRSSFDVRVR